MGDIMRIILSKNQWEDMGKKAGWIKISQDAPVEVDGKYYIEKDGDMVEVPNPNLISQTPSNTPKSYSISAYDVTFMEGRIYTNYYGDFKVIKINDEKATMDVQYVNVLKPDVNTDDIYTYNMLVQAKSIHNERVRQHNKFKISLLDLKDPSDYFTMGYVAKNGIIRAEIGPKHHKSFPESYQRVTGEDALAFLHHGLSLSQNEDRWSYTLRLFFSTPPPEALNKMKFPPNSEIKNREGQMELASNDYIWTLFKRGFSIGKNEQNVDRIMGKILNEDNKKDFLSGFNL